MLGLIELFQTGLQRMDAYASSLTEVCNFCFLSFLCSPPPPPSPPFYLPPREKQHTLSPPIPLPSPAVQTEDRLFATQTTVALLHDRIRAVTGERDKFAALLEFCISSLPPSSRCLASPASSTLFFV